jgi:hypothetical protein
MPGNPFLLLWDDAVSGLGLDHRNLRRARNGLEKFVLPLGAGFAAEPIPLHAVYFLDPPRSEELKLTVMRGLASIKTLNTIPFRPGFIVGMDLSGRYSRQIAEIARQTKVVVVERPQKGLRVNELADFLAADFAA